MLPAAGALPKLDWLRPTGKGLHTRSSFSSLAEQTNQFGNCQDLCPSSFAASDMTGNTSVATQQSPQWAAISHIYYYQSNML
jgi:hypothetical protein